jgi:hypothetical protein
VAAELPGDDADERTAVVGGQQRDVGALDRLIPRGSELVLLRQVHPELDAVERPAAFDQFCRWRFDVQDAGARRHPLRRAVGDQPATTVRILVREPAVDHVGDRFESAVRMPVGPPGLAGLVFHLAHLVHVHEWVQRGGADPGERADHRKSFALIAVRPGGDRPDRTLGVGRTGRGHPRQCQCVCGYRGHL